LLLPAFERAYNRVYHSKKTQAGKLRKRQVGGGRQGSLASIEQKLLFVLVYQKAYPLQVLQGEVFALGQSQANRWIHRLLPVLTKALDNLHVLPARNPRQFARREKRRAEALDFIVDGTDGDKGLKTLRNKPCTTVARKRLIAIKM
jgi:hypothetical protein